MDSQLTLLDNTGVTEIVYADDVCGTNASITWTATLTGTVRILVSRFNCSHDLTSNVTLAYRMTMVDQDGNIKHTELIAAKTCRPVTESLMKTYAVHDGQVIVHLNQENCAYRLWDVSGKLISEKQDISGNEAHLQAPAEGMYILHLSDKNGSEETHRIYIH